MKENSVEKQTPRIDNSTTSGASPRQRGKPGKVVLVEGDEWDPNDNEGWESTKTGRGKLRLRGRLEAIVFRAPEGSLGEKNLNTLCQQVEQVVKRRLEEPRFTKDGCMVIVAENAEDREALLKLKRLGGIQGDARTGGRSPRSQRVRLRAYTLPCQKKR